MDEETSFSLRMILRRKRESTELETIKVICFKIAAKAINYSFWLLLQASHFGWRLFPVMKII